ncbi:MAG: putative lipopolysaccharide heptosyltransferase III [Nitrospirales bacterium]|nr:putative lipopolysaccharide heptosyltransferase III [Nitrospira sp.]MDR4502406.1 putative lipopolysaccharide heptosyltransferase III [Nitrospirales bacterium]
MRQSQMERILVIKLRYIGDVLFSTPVLRKLREHYPKSRITCLVNAGTEDVLRHNPDVDEVLVVARGSAMSQVRFGLKLRQRCFDCVIDLTDGDRSALLSWVSGANVRVGFNRENRWRGRLYTECVEIQDQHRHMVDQHLQTLSSIGTPLGEIPNPTVFVGKEDERNARDWLSESGLLERRWVMIHPAARYWFKAWPLERFADLIDRLSADGFMSVLVGQEQEKGEKIQALANAKVLSCIGRTDVLELAALMKHAALFIGNDTGLMHIAAAVECPVIGLFGPTDPQTWGPRGKRTTVIYKGLDCRACFHPGCFRGEESCMKQIFVEEVHASALELLQK